VNISFFQFRKWAAIFCLIIACFIFRAWGSPTNIYDLEYRDFHHGLFDYGGRYNPEQRDPTLPLTDQEIAILKGNGFEHLNPQSGRAFVDYNLERMGVVRAVGFQKQEQWIPILIGKVAEIQTFKSNLQNLEFNYPCIWALAQIGEPSVEPIMEAFIRSENREHRGLLFRALEGIRGKEGAAKLLNERGIDINRRIDGPSRPSKRVLPGDDKRKAGEGYNGEGRQTPESDESSKSQSKFAWYSFFLFALICALFIRKLRK
jgi:hypothetical protein